MATPQFESFARNGEDVVLWRAFSHIAGGRYIHVGAQHPSEDSISRAFYDHGWRGITVESAPHLAELHRRERPGDVLFEAVDAKMTLDGVLDDAGWQGHDIHFLSIDARGDEVAVLGGIDLPRWRPWVVAVTSAAPDSGPLTHDERDALVTGAGYHLALFDGLTRFYVASEREHEIGERLTAPAGILDNFTTWRERKLVAERDAAIRQSILWRTAALERWNDRMGESSEAASRVAEQFAELQKEYTALLATVSWRVTKPLRSIHERFPGHRGGE